MKNCSSCKHKLSLYTGLMDNSHSLVDYRFVANTGGVCEDFYVKCANNHTEECVTWWKDNGGKPTNETSEMTCFEPTELSVKLDATISKLDELLEKLDKKI